MAVWDALERVGARVRRVPLRTLAPWEVQLVLTHELRRLRALAEYEGTPIERTYA